MNNKTDFNTMLTMMWDLQVPIITAEYLDEEFYGRWSCTDHIVIPDGKDKVTDFVFVKHHDGCCYLGSITSLNMSFDDALVHFSKLTLRNQGALLKLHSN